MISIANLFLLTAPKGMPLQIISGRGVFTKDDALNLIAQAQGKFPVGIKVLEARIGGIGQAAFTLRETLTSALLQDDVEMPEAKALSRMAVDEVCGTRICQKCKGRGYSISNWNGSAKQVLCKRCYGVGHILKTSLELAQTISVLLQREVTEDVFTQMYYDQYMDCVNQLWQESGEAERECKRLMRLWREVA
jgi:hypothetical protein